MKYSHIIILFLLIPCFNSCAGTPVFTLLDVSKKIYPVIITPDAMNKYEVKALRILVSSIKECTGQTVTIKKEAELENAEKNTSLIYIGKTKASSVVRLPLVKNDGYFILQKGNALYISAQNEQAIIYAIYYFTEHYLNGFKPDEGAPIFLKKQLITLPANFSIVEEPAFNFRQAYFPASNKLEYQHWHHTQHFEDIWGIWGHNLHKLLTVSDPQLESINIYALINGKRNKEQYCFSSDELYQQIASAIKKKIALGSEAINWSIAPNDNSYICQCEKCKAVNNANSATNAIVTLINKLAATFPNLIFTTLAYATTIAPPTNIKLAQNAIVFLSTIDLPKGISIEKQKGFKKFNSLLKEWSAVCNTIYIWDYTIQYTNYMDIFPNIPTLQKDLQYFKKVGIKGVFEHGSETNYSIFTEWKSYIISKLLWNPSIDVNKLRTDFFNEFYGPYGKNIEQFYIQCEDNLTKNDAALDIYGNMQFSSDAYLDYTQLENILAYLQKAIAVENVPNPRIYYNVHKLATCIDILLLQYNLWKGIDPRGYAIRKDSVSWMIKPDIAERIAKIKKAAQNDEIEVMNEGGTLVKDYLSTYSSFLKNSETKNLIWKKQVSFHSSFVEEYPANGVNTLNDGNYGTTDFSYNWLLFNNVPLDISISNIFISGASKITFNFLNDPPHYIFLPKSIKIYLGTTRENATLISEIKLKEIRNNKAEIIPFTVNINSALSKSKFIHIVAENYPALPDWKTHPSKKPSIACDEINIQ